MTTPEMMTIRAAQIEDFPPVRRLLEGEKLPIDIIEERKGKLWVMEENGRVVGSGALEFYGADALLRSMVVSDALKGSGHGTRLVSFLEKEAGRQGVRTVWLLTETAEGFFRKLGYTSVDRSVVVNKGILDSSEFAHLCASTAVCMKKDLPASKEKE